MARKRRATPRRRIRRKRNHSTPIFGVVLLVAVLILIALVIGDHGVYRLIKLRQERSAIQNRITELRARQAELKLEENHLESDIEYIEKLAREKYRMARKGERVFKVVEKPNPGR